MGKKDNDADMTERYSTGPRFPYDSEGRARTSVASAGASRPWAGQRRVGYSVECVATVGIKGDDCDRLIAGQGGLRVFMVTCEACRQMEKKNARADWES